MGQPGPDSPLRDSRSSSRGSPDEALPPASGARAPHPALPAELPKDYLRLAEARPTTGGKDLPTKGARPKGLVPRDSAHTLRAGATPGRRPGAGAASGQERLKDISQERPDLNQTAFHGQRLKEIKEVSCQQEEVCAWEVGWRGGGWAAEDGKQGWAESGGLLMPSQGWSLFGGQWEPQKALEEGEIMRLMLGVFLIHACVAAWIMCMPVPC